MTKLYYLTQFLGLRNLGLTDLGFWIGVLHEAAVKLSAGAANISGPDGGGGLASKVAVGRRPRLLALCCPEASVPHRMGVG